MSINFVLLTIIAILFPILYAARWLQTQHALNRKKSTTPFNIHPLANKWLEKGNLLISGSSFIPTWMAVYLIGGLETVVTFIWKRGLLGAPSHQNTEQAINRLLVKREDDLSQGTEARINAIVTGADSGIGYEIARGLLVAGFHVIIATRSVDLGRKAKRELEELTGSSHISYYTLDLCSFDSVNKFVDQMKSVFNNGDLDVLISNAGVMNIPCTFTEDGYETQCQTNYLAPLRLAISLLPLMNQDHGHILFAASSTLYATSHLDPRTTKTSYGWDGLSHYAYSKMCVTQLSRFLGQKLVKQSSRIKVNCYHPGAVRTKLFHHTTLFQLRVIGWLFDFIMLTPKEGSGTALYLIMKYLDGDDDMNYENGRYWANGEPQELPSKVAIQTPVSSIGATSTTLDINQLWTVSLEQIGITPMEVDQYIRSTVKNNL